MEKKIFYAVTKGDYSDYHIVAITDDEEKAQKLAKVFSDDWDEAKVEKYPDCAVVDMPIFSVMVGSVATCVVQITPYTINNINVVNEYRDKQYSVYVQAKDEEHAQKIAYDLIAEYKARKAGV